MIEKEKLEMLGINTGEGLAYCADDWEFYEEMLDEYVNEARAKISEMEQFFAQQDWAEYRIRVHSLKSSSRMIGASELAEHAYMLEIAAKETDEDYILQHHAGFLKNCRALIDALSA